MNHNFRNNSNIVTYEKKFKKPTKTVLESTEAEALPEPLTTKNAVRYLLDGTLRLRVCRYCLNVCPNLSELEEILEIGINGGTHEITIKDMVAAFHPFNVDTISNFPTKICQECLKRAINAYLFTQQCERSERAIRNCFEDINEKFFKLDPVEPVKRRGKRKLNPNPNVLYVENEKVIEYADPIINIMNTNTVLAHEVEINTLECPKCWLVLPNIQSLANHDKSHPKSMWYHCKHCGKSFIKRFHLRQHLKKVHQPNAEKTELPSGFRCNTCGDFNNNLGEHFRHIEKHKFKLIIEHMLTNKMDQLCSLCLEKGTRMTDFSEMIHIHGAFLRLAGNQSVYHIISTIFSDLTFNKQGSVCDTCLDHAITSYVFNLKVEHVLNRLDTCVTHVFNSLDSIDYDSENTVMIEISEEIILPMVNYDVLGDIGNEEELTVEFLEDEFRQSESETESEEESSSEEENLAKNATKTYSKKKLVNGYQSDYKLSDVCEFLTFNKKRKMNSLSVFTCPFCNKYFVSDYFLKKHLLKHIEKKVQCKKCCRTFASKFHLFEHIKITHVLKNKDYDSCDVCGRVFSNLNKLKSHQKCHFDKECHLCNKQFKFQSNFNVHMQRHVMNLRLYRNKDQQTCSFCEKACSNENEHSLHVNKVHLQMKPYSCDMCEKSYYTEYNLNSHKKLHDLLSKEVCTLCKKTLKCRKDLVIHVRKHTGSKPHRCPICRKSFYSDNRLRKHMKLYHGGRFWCRLCKAVVKTSNNLRIHISLAHGAM